MKYLSVDVVIQQQILNSTNHCASSWQSAIFLRSVRMTTHAPWNMPCARDYWWTSDFANAFLSPGVNSRAELVPSPRAYARNGASRRWLGENCFCHRRNLRHKMSLNYQRYSMNTVIVNLAISTELIDVHSSGHGFSQFGELYNFQSKIDFNKLEFYSIFAQWTKYNWTVYKYFFQFSQLLVWLASRFSLACSFLFSAPSIMDIHTGIHNS